MENKKAIKQQNIAKTLKIAWFLSRYHHFSNNLLKVYFSNGYIKPLIIIK